MSTLLELFDLKTTLDYVNDRQFQTYEEGTQFFPETKYPTLEFEYFMGGNNQPVAAKIHAFDTEAEIGSVEGFKKALEAAYIKKKYQITEKDLIALRQAQYLPQAQQQVVYRRIFNVLEKAVNDVRSTVEIMRMQAIANGELRLDIHSPQGGTQTLVLDYGVPAANKVTLAGANLWSDPTADIIGNIQTWADSLEEGATFALTSRKVASNMIKNQGIIRALYGVNAGRQANLADINNYFTSIGLPTIIVYGGQGGAAKTYREQQADGTYVTRQYFPEDKFVLLPNGPVGETLYGPTPDEGRFLDKNIITEFNGNVIGYYYESGQDPIGTWAKAASTAIPSFPMANHVFQAKVLA